MEQSTKNAVPTEQTMGRRELLKAMAATSGAVLAASMLPGQWTKPIIDAGVLPAHALVSGTSLTIAIADSANFDLKVEGPNGTKVVTDPEYTEKGPNNAGTYKVYVKRVSNDTSARSTVSIKISDISGQVDILVPNGLPRDEWTLIDTFSIGHTTSGSKQSINSIK